jgi:cytochrome c peroxidase
MCYRSVPLILLCLALLACAAPAPDDIESSPQGLTLAELASIARGRELFVHEDFDGNGRVCATCHLMEGGDNFDFGPADAQLIFSTEPTNALFRSIDAECGSGTNYTTLLSKGLVRIPFRLPSNVTVDEPDGCMIHTNPDGSRTVFVLRSTPTVENIALETAIMWDGREHGDLPHQAGSAVETHNEPGRLPTTQEKADMAAFQRTRFSNLRLRVYAACLRGPHPESCVGPTLPTIPSFLHGAHWDSARRGRNFFVSMPIVASTNPALRGGHCATCHNGPLLDTSNAFNPFSAPGVSDIQNNFTSEVNGAVLPTLTYHIAVQHPVVMPPGIPPLPCTPTTACFPPAGTPLFPPGAVFTVRSPDLGTIYTTGDPCPPGAETFCLVGSNPVTGLTTTSFFRTSTLWGVADSAPYFHDNSCEDLACVVKHYQDAVFSITSAPTGNPGWDLSASEQADIVAYMEEVFVRTTPL